MEAWGFVMTAVDAARAAVLATGLLSEVLWPARHALLAVVLLLFYVHGGLGEPESEDPTLF
jgi:hypothetical protein